MNTSCSTEYAPLNHLMMRSCTLNKNKPNTHSAMPAAGWPGAAGNGDAGEAGGNGDDNGGGAAVDMARICDRNCHLESGFF